MQGNIHIPEGTSFRDYVRDSLGNALENADNEFLARVERRDVEFIAADLARYDAGVDRALELASDRSEALFREIVSIVREWCDVLPKKMSAPMKHDDFSSNPRRWSWQKLLAEKKNGMPAVVAEYERRMSENEDE